MTKIEAQIMGDEDAFHRRPAPELPAHLLDAYMTGRGLGTQRRGPDPAPPGLFDSSAYVRAVLAWSPYDETPRPAWEE